ncbi:IclR family transcriptional regulator [Microbacterium album]|uniref:IclR family transcriptional regulator n=1 Tax=Microbacterium album TaxID=2053191 RepID=A0A917IH35_9MICO|nr:IclR family transcriptional regulator [Microbacterium album]GGH48871.1 IclR family transcriptional regulator [Microbacterium album]
MSDTREARSTQTTGGERPVPRSIDRALSVIDTFRHDRTRQTLSEISRHSGLPIATTYRIVERLTAWGALEREPGGRYHIGLRLWEVSTLAPRSMALQRVARPFMHDLYEITHYSVHLAIKEGLEVVFVERFQSPHQVLHRGRVGGRLPMYHSATGKVLLAYAPPEEREETLRALADAEDGLPPLDEVRNVLAHVHARGYATSSPELNPDYMAVAAPIVAPGGAVIASLSLVVKAGDTAERDALHLVRVAAGGITRALAGRR